MLIKTKVNDTELLKYIYKAAEEYKELIDKSFLLIGKNRNTDYYWFQCKFEKKNFMHLLGIKSRNYSADEFFDKCDEYNRGVGNGITIGDCTPSGNHNRTTVNEKCSVASNILKIQDARYFKIGDKEKISQYVDFNYAYGREVTLGFRKDGKGSSFPITLIPKSIDTFSTQKYKIVFVYKKDIKETSYKDLYVEIKTGIMKEHYSEFPENLQKLISL